MKRRRLVILIAAGTVLSLVAVAAPRFLFSRPEGQGPAGPPVPRAPFTEVWSTRPVLLLGLGDSVTAGFGVPHTHGYVSRLADNPEDEFPEMQGVCLREVYPNLRVENSAQRRNFEDPNVRGYDAIRRLFLLEILKIAPDKGREL